MRIASDLDEEARLAILTDLCMSHELQFQLMETSASPDGGVVSEGDAVLRD